MSARPRFYEALRAATGSNRRSRYFYFLGIASTKDAESSFLGANVLSHHAFGSTIRCALRPSANVRLDGTVEIAKKAYLIAKSRM